MTLRAALARGFTLIEMAIVMVVIGLVLSGGLVAVAPIIQNSKVSETNEKLGRIEQALTLYVIRNGCLPCPAEPALATSATNSGDAHGLAGYYSTGCDTGCDATTVATQGVVPWITLGLSEADITDGWGARIDYAVTSGLVTTSGMVRTPPSSYPAGTIIVKDPTATTTQTTAAAYVVISHGPNRAYAHLSNTGSGPITDPNSSTKELDNSNGTPFRQGDWDTVAGAGTNYFDDLVRWRSAPMIIQLCGTNACGNPA